MAKQNISDIKYKSRNQKRKDNENIRKLSSRKRTNQVVVTASWAKRYTDRHWVSLDSTGE